MGSDRRRGDRVRARALSGAPRVGRGFGRGEVRADRAEGDASRDAHGADRARAPRHGGRHVGGLPALRKPQPPILRPLDIAGLTPTQVARSGAGLRRLRREARAASRLARVGLLAAAWLLVLSAGGASAVVSGPCDFTLAGRSVAALPGSDPGNPIQLTIETPVRVGWRMRAADPITIVVDTGTFPVATYALNPRTARGTDAIDLRTLDGVAAGLYHVTAATNRCEADTWVRVVTPSPLTTAAGLAGLGLLVVGLILAISGIVAGARVRGGRLRAILGGAVAGAGALVVSQQLGLVPLQPHWIAAWRILPGAVGGLGHFAVSQATGAARVPGRTAPRVDDERGYRPDTRTGGLEETTIAAPSGVGGATAGVGAEPPPPIDMPTAGSALPPAAQPPAGMPPAAPPPAALPPAAPPAAALPPTAAPAAGAAAPAAGGSLGGRA